MDCPILVWMLTYNRVLNEQEYKQCYDVMRSCVPHAQVPYDPKNEESRLKVISFLLPLVMMRHRRVSRHRWKDYASEVGKHWIEMDSDVPMNPHYRARSMIGYHTHFAKNLIGMVMTQGPKHQVVNLGLSFMSLDGDRDENTTVMAYFESQFHKLTPMEIGLIQDFKSNPGEDKRNEQPDITVMRRLAMLLTLKQAYIKAIGQPIGFDLSRLEFNVPEGQARGDGQPLQGWEFRVWQAHIEVMQENGTTKEQHYQCACAFFRGTAGVRFMWQKDVKELESWVQFLTPDQLMAVLPKLSD